MLPAESALSSTTNTFNAFPVGTEAEVSPWSNAGLFSSNGRLTIKTYCHAPVPNSPPQCAPIQKRGWNERELSSGCRHGNRKVMADPAHALLRAADRTR